MSGWRNNLGLLAAFTLLAGCAKHPTPIASILRISQRNEPADLDPALVKKEREILSEQARKEGKPENIIEKMIEGRMRNFYAEHVLSEQPFIKDDKQTVGKLAESGGMKLVKFIRWQLGEANAETAK